MLVRPHVQVADAVIDVLEVAASLFDSRVEFIIVSVPTLCRSDTNPAARLRHADFDRTKSISKPKYLFDSPVRKPDVVTVKKTPLWPIT